MACSFCISVCFLRPICHGRNEKGQPEWPPSPLRLFQALVAAAAARWEERTLLEYAVPALCWLERQGPSVLLAPNGIPADAKYRLYVPDNIGDKVAAAWSRGGTAAIADYRTEKDVRPTHFHGGAVHYLFALAGAAGEFEKHRETLTATARHLTHLGWGIDMVVGNAAVISEADAAMLSGERWLPNEAPHTPGLRVPREGTLDDLIHKHDAFLHRLVRDARGNESFNPVPPLSAFRIVGYRRDTDVPPRPYAAFVLYRPDEDKMRSFPAMRAVSVAGMLRCVTGKMARQTGHCDPEYDLDKWVNEYVTGHGESDGLRARFSYLPLPTIRPPNVLGQIRRVVLAEPPGGMGAHVAWASQALRGQILLSEQRREEALLLPLGPVAGILRHYVGTSDTWATVSPLVLPGSDEGKFAKAEKLFFKALRHAGYCPDALADLEFRNASFWPGGDLALRFDRPDYLKKDYWSVYHIRLRWKHPVKGPLAVGAGRHCGLGIFAATNERGIDDLRQTARAGELPDSRGLRQASAP